MEFFKEFRQERQGNKVLEALNKDFWYRDGPWLYNREWDVFRDRNLSIKSRFAFDRSEELKSTDFYAKIGINNDRAIPHAFIGFAYADKKDMPKLEEYSKQYPWAELITNLDRGSLSTEKSEYIPITKDA